MNYPRSYATLRQSVFGIIFLMFAAIATAFGFWLATSDETKLKWVKSGAPAELSVGVTKWKAAWDDEGVGAHRNGVSEAKVGSAHRQPLQYRAEAGRTTAAFTILASGNQTVNERIRQVQTMRGIVLSKEERDSIMAFFAGKQIPVGMGKGSMQWLADELMTVLRLQQPPQEGLAAELGKAAFQSGTDPVVRDYLMQHLGHLWEQFGAREEIEKSLWLAVASSDETTPGSALIALSRGYQRDKQQQNLEKVRQQAFALAQNPATGLAVRVTALSIAGEGGDTVVKELATCLVQDPATPVILRKVAEHVVQHVP